jgi:DnaJ-class molecular chaperone
MNDGSPVDFDRYWSRVVVGVERWDLCWRCQGNGAIRERVRRGKFWGRVWVVCLVCDGWGITA